MSEYQNKYQDAYDRIYVATNGGDGLAWELNQLHELIAMHTVPLKFEELKRDMLIWDNKKKSYLFIHSIQGRFIDCFEFSYAIETALMDTDFEDGRFYRYQPLE